MNNFSKQLQTEEGFLLFNFSKVETPTVNKFFIQVTKNDTVQHSFEMKLNSQKKWKAVPPVPHHILKMEEKLAAVIENQYNGNA